MNGPTQNDCNSVVEAIYIGDHCRRSLRERNVNLDQNVGERAIHATFAERMATIVTGIVGTVLGKLLINLVIVAMVASPIVAADSTVVVLLDDSGSMRQEMRTGSGREPRMSVAQAALTKVIQQLPDQTTLGILLMNGARSENGWLVRLGPLDRKAALSRLAQVRADGGTPLGQSMMTAMDELLSMRSKLPYGDYRLLVVTDGEASDANMLQRYLPDMVARGISIDAIGVDMRADHTLAQSAHSYRKANDAASFEQALTEIFAESTASNSDRGSSDYELLAALPDEFAVESLKALSQVQNGAIGEVPMVTPQARTPSAPTPAITPSPSAATGPPSTPEPAPESRFNPLPFIIIVVIVYMVGRLFVQQKKKRRS